MDDAAREGDRRKTRDALVERLEKAGVIRFDCATGTETTERVIIRRFGKGCFALADQVLVRLDDLERAQEQLGKAVLAVVYRPLSGIARIVLRPGTDLCETLEHLAKADPPVHATPNHLLFTAHNWRIQEGEDPEPAERPKGPSPDDTLGTGVRVAVVDNGIARESLSDAWLHGIRPGPEDIDPLRVYEPKLHPGSDDLDVGAGHGTFVAGVIRQLAPDCAIDVIRALDSDGVGTDDEVAEGLARAAHDGSQFINLSFGGYSFDDEPPLGIDEAIRHIPGEVIVVAAAGNEDTERPVWPGALRRVVSVAATTQRGEDHEDVTTDLAEYSNRGWWVDVAAPGTWVSTFVTGDENPALETDGQPDHFAKPYAEAAGTSFAAAAVSGALAGELSARGGTPRDALKRLLARPGNKRLPWGGVSLDVWGD
jgi:subtilisin family serine protease